MMKNYVDYSKLKEITQNEKNITPIFNKHEINILALANGYYKTPVAAEHEHGDAFMNKVELYNFTRIPFEFANGHSALPL